MVRRQGGRDAGRLIPLQAASVRSRLFRVDRQFYVALARAFAGAILFGLPLFMTMEMWWLGFEIRPERIALFLLVSLPLLWGLAWHTGFREDVSWLEALVDAGVAALVGLCAGATVLLLLGVLTPDMSVHEILGKIALQTVPAGMGAALARSQLGMRERDNDTEELDKKRQSYASELFLMVAGGLFFAFNVAPTEEIVVIAHFQESPWYPLATVAVSLAMLHAFVYSLEFKGQHSAFRDRPLRAEFLGLTLPGYVLVLLVCLYVLWTFGRIDGRPPLEILQLVLVLGFPATLGAASARLVL
jgi:putative integral membrane protein (TIGR02587 family)